MLNWPSRVATAQQLKDINKTAIERNYNRALVDNYFRRLGDGVVVLQPIMKHHHAQGKEVPVHYRCFIYGADPENGAGLRGQIDVDPDVFEALPVVDLAGL